MPVFPSLSAWTAGSTWSPPASGVLQRVDLLVWTTALSANSLSCRNEGVSQDLQHFTNTLLWLDRPAVAVRDASVHTQLTSASCRQYLISCMRRCPGGLWTYAYDTAPCSLSEDFPSTAALSLSLYARTSARPHVCTCAKRSGLGLRTPFVESFLPFSPLPQLVGCQCSSAARRPCILNPNALPRLDRPPLRYWCSAMVNVHTAIYKPASSSSH
ncbi:hypothetical protein L226DRAFT_261232 [Lentinus tigrinus ALCF2SS1-7]|uniref:Uncharacterized protein n=1 Tax=Lentinus tigrinus ALCF2SS1-6 TaxID=1328759 RepID=A0A5C2RUA2_9APHY|nr:hypothetical protein L227DRAFT_344870 [Lentinus tigrinus ALCF2SS1-6]RPD70057.1 hypothetical protein L226DRAFT_261232 [Lentinus tigrinus ALCF2SS1-7]